MGCYPGSHSVIDREILETVRGLAEPKGECVGWSRRRACELRFLDAEQWLTRIEKCGDLFL
jgi:hypothetical protein